MAQTPDPVPNRSISALEGRLLSLERALFESQVAATPAELRARLGLRCVTRGSLGAIACEADPHLLFNRVTGIGLSGSVQRTELEAFFAELRAPGRPDNFLALASERVPGPELERELAALGLVRFRRDWVALVRPPTPAAPAPAPFPIAAASRDDAAAFAEILSDAFELSASARDGLSGLVGRAGWHVLVARDAQRVVSAGALFVHGGLAYFTFAATRPSHRGKGAHDALIARRIELARELGCDTLIVETGTPVAGEPSPSLGNLKTAGFRPAFLRPAFVPPGASWTGRRA